MGVDARMVVRLASPLTDAEIVDASYRLSEACGHHEVFWQSNDESMARGEMRRALNRVPPAGDEESEYRACGIEAGDGMLVWVSLWGRYYGEGYERGNLWTFIAVAEWMERNFHGCRVFYGGDTGESLEPFSAREREELIAHWAANGGRPYYAREGKSYPSWYGDEHPLRPTCPLCQYKATQYGSGREFASWQCDGCKRHWVWIGGDRVNAFGPSYDFDSFKAAEEMRLELVGG